MRKVILSLSVFLASFLPIYAFEADLNIEKNDVNINNSFQITLKISDVEENIWVEEIKWLENFEILSQWQTQKFSSKSVIINWKREQKANQIVSLNLILKAKKTWDFIIWPAILKTQNEEKKSNEIKVKINWKQIVSGNNLSNNILTPTNNNDKKFREKYKKQKYFPEKSFLEKYYKTFIISLILFIIAVIFVIIFTRNNVKKEEDEDKKIEKEDFEEDKKEIIFPEIKDENFTEKIENNIKQIFKNKYNLKNKNLLSEYLDLLKNKTTKTNLELLIKELNKLKYSNLLVSKTKILEICKKF